MRLELMSDNRTTNSGGATRALAGTAITAVVMIRPTPEIGMDQTNSKCVTRLMWSTMERHAVDGLVVGRALALD